MDTSEDKLKLAKLYEHTLYDGTKSYWTTYAFDIEFESNLYIASPIRATSYDQTADLSVGECRITLPRMSPWINVSKLKDRYLDNSTLKITWIDRTDHTNKRVSFIGFAGQVAYNHNIVSITYKNQFNLFQKSIPNRKYTEGCGHTMYDGKCKLVRADWQVSGTATVPVSGQTKSNLFDTTILNDDHYFDLGILTFTSGLNNGEERWVRLYKQDDLYIIGKRFEFQLPLPNLPVTGDTYVVVPHCKKTYTSCQIEFGNELNYGGFEDIPDPTEALV